MLENWVKTNDDARGTYNTNSQIKLQFFGLCDYSSACILIKGTITVANNVL